MPSGAGGGTGEFRSITKPKSQASEFFAGLGRGYKVGLLPARAESLPELIKGMYLRSNDSTPYLVGSKIGIFGGVATVITAIPVAVLGTVAAGGAVINLLRH